MAIHVDRIGSRIFVASGVYASNRELGIAARESKWNSGIDYSDRLVMVSQSHVGNVNSRTYVAVDKTADKRPYSLMRAAKAILASV